MLTLESWLVELIPYRGIVYWLFAANYLLAVGFVVSEIFRSRTSQGSIAWIITLLILPFPMTLIYAIFGIKSFDDYAVCAPARPKSSTSRRPKSSLSSPMSRSCRSSRAMKSSC